MSLCRTSHLSRDNILLPHISAVPLMNADLMTAGAAEREAQIQRMSKAKSGTSLHCRYIFLSGTEQQWGHSYISLQISGVKSVSASSGPWLGRSQATQQEVCKVRASEASSVFIAALHRSHFCLSYASFKNSGSISFSQKRKLQCNLHIRQIQVARSS